MSVAKLIIRDDLARSVECARPSRRAVTSLSALVLTGLVYSPAMAEDAPYARSELSFYGLPGLIDMPTSDMMPDGELAVTVSNFAGMTRSTLAFQFAPRLVGSFRYSAIKDWDADGFSTYYDRSFDLRFQALTETETRPSVTIGLQDFIGTGIYSAEFIVASKTFADKFSVTGGLGWGRFASFGAFGATGTRPDDPVGTGGQLDANTWFRGDVAAFGGIAWRPTPQWTLKAEYSSDAYVLEADEHGLFDVDIPFNFGAEYQPSQDFRIGAYALYGSEIGVNFQVNINPSRPTSPGSLDPAPPPVLQRPSRASSPEYYSTEWSASEGARIQIRDQLAEALLGEGMELEALDLQPTSVTLYLRNQTYQATPQALGRSSRLMARMLPSSIDTFTIVLMADGLRLPAVTFSRSDIERFETSPDGAEQMLNAAVVGNPVPAPTPDEYAPDIYPRFNWSFRPYVQTSLFDPDAPFRADVGVGLGADIVVAPGLLFGASFIKKIAGNLDENERESNSTLQHVRSDFAEYDKNGDPAMRTLYGSYLFQPSEEIYGAVTVGYLERMFAGISTEVLWAPFDSRLALGAQLSYVQQRDFEGGFGLQDYNVVTGFGTAYWQVTDDYMAQVDVGRYLAGDHGATLSLERVFNNGWSVGAFATYTDVSAEQFGEGSFDKGITMNIPLNWLLGRSTRVSQGITVRPLTRDGGAQLSVPQRLYPLVAPITEPRQKAQWGSFWR